MLNQDPKLAGQLVVSIEDILDFGMQAVIFDHAGVLVDCEKLHGQARQMLINNYGYNITAEEGRSYKGHGEKMLYQYFTERGMFPDMVAHVEAEATRLGRESWELYREHHTQQYHALYDAKSEEDRLALIFDYVPEVMAAAKERSLPVAVVSNSDRPEVERDSGLAIAKANRILTARQATPFTLRHPFNYFSTADDMNATGCPHKPSPAPYLMCLFELAKQPVNPVTDVSKCLVFEDAPKGLDAAFKAGTSVIQVLNQTDHANDNGRDERALGYLFDHHASSMIVLNPQHEMALTINRFATVRRGTPKP